MCLQESEVTSSCPPQLCCSRPVLQMLMAVGASEHALFSEMFAINCSNFETACDSPHLLETWPKIPTAATSQSSPLRSLPPSPHGALATKI